MRGMTPTVRKHDIYTQFWLAEAATDDRTILKLIIEMYVVNAYMQLADNFQNPFDKLTMNILKERPTF